jgi:hypothetical protein
MAGRPSKPIALVKGHRTKAEIAVRKKNEEALLTGTKLQEWPEVKANPEAHKEFLRVRKLLHSINKDDDLFGAMVNTHCKLKGEIQTFEDMKDAILAQIEELAAMHKVGDIETTSYIQERGKLQDRYMTCDKKIMEKRKMMLDISKENIMTIQGALRTIPKKPEKKEESPMAEYLRKKREAQSR